MSDYDPDDPQAEIDMQAMQLMLLADDGNPHHDDVDAGREPGV